MKRSDIPEILAALLILMFTYAAFSKLWIFPAYRTQMLMQPLPRWSVSWLIYILPSVELLISAGLLFKATRWVAFYASTILMSLFSLYVGLALAGVFGTIPCTCGGIISAMTWTQHLLFNLSFLSISIYGLVLDLRERRFIGS